MKNQKLRTLAVHGGSDPAANRGALVTPIYQSSTYLMESDTPYADIRYVRLNNSPNHLAVGAKLAALEGTETAVVTASGMAAITSTLMALLQSGDHLLAQAGLYGGTQSFLARAPRQLGVEVSNVDLEDPGAWEAAVRPSTRVFLVESVSNPLLAVGRLDEVVSFSRRHGLLTVIDNTFPSPVNFRPVELGYDLIVHSATKSLNGHSDLAAGVVAGSRELVGKVRENLGILGGSLDPHAVFLLDRGIKTLPLRMQAQNIGAQQVAEFLATEAGIAEVRYPGLPNDAAHERSTRWFDGFGSMIAFELPDASSAKTVLAKLELFMHAPSLGGVESLACRPAAASHAGVAAEIRERQGIREGLIRLSIGIEDPEDLINDLRQALPGR